MIVIFYVKQEFVNSYFNKFYDGFVLYISLANVWL